jgi:hypothetical protein
LTNGRIFFIIQDFKFSQIVLPTDVSTCVENNHSRRRVFVSCGVKITYHNFECEQFSLATESANTKTYEAQKYHCHEIVNYPSLAPSCLIELPCNLFSSKGCNSRILPQCCIQIHYLPVDQDKKYQEAVYFLEQVNFQFTKLQKNAPFLSEPKPGTPNAKQVT